VTRSWARSALVALVFLLGLLQGTRAALGDMPLAGDVAAPPPEASAAAPATPRETGPAGGRFFRPAGSDAQRPELRLRPSHWRPHAPERLARRCGGAAC
jgi:hypothetical protein